MDRRDVLRLLRWAATAASVFPATVGDEHERVASVLTRSSRVDAQTIEHIEAILWHCRQQDHALGPQAVLTTVLAQRDLTRALVPDCPETLRPRMLSALSEASRQAGWLSFDLKQFDHAGYYYEDARALAHEAQNTGLGALVVLTMPSQPGSGLIAPMTCACAPTPPTWLPGPMPPMDSETPA
jgi:hypothetical protein